MTFEEWWEKHGQYVRCGGGQYEASFAYAAWNASRDQALEQAAAAVEKHDQAGREWVPGSFWGTLAHEAGGRIRALKSGGEPG